MNKYRLTQTRSQLLKLLKNTPLPVSAEDLLQKVPVNKTTIYRQLTSMVAQGLIKPVLFTDRTLRYESADRDHHHHLICTNCKKIIDISFPENIEQTAQTSASAQKFKINTHHLEFFGLCQNCQ
ncbi:hypothetical protein A2397_01045 [Candidatus Amesbacteria bacterium RIFOXYB1_FULL_44_23]|uniref:Transcriptional repressor n=1 Tax=Candidatus Amesbacteria bacterium RIFOXYB1_FULL_44_23 TaxID=1797263 RepID=A0A1F4ZUI8_9BACT|nr:MAG: hypothetical protein A2397_01045 [Candidatus Amesbacteria bacterium RIFOXYB1_FULL_44_23]